MNWTLVVLAFFVSIELTCRIDDWLRTGYPITETPDRARDLMLCEESICRGRPHGRFKKFVLNNFGFRGPDISLDPPNDITRVMVLGASETFGLYESEFKEYPAQLNSLLNVSGRFEVVNAAMPGLTLRTMIQYWEKWASRFRPEFVLIYPMPLFYINIDSARAAQHLSEQTQTARVNKNRQISLSVDSSRFLFKLKDFVHTPSYIQKFRDAKSIEAQTNGKSDDWFFYSIPQENMEWYISDLSDLVDSIEARGAKAVIMTPTWSCALPIGNEDINSLQQMRVYTPRAMPEVLVDFQSVAVKRIIQLGTQKGCNVIDIASRLDGKKEFFAELVHFNDAGAGVVASIIADHFLSQGSITEFVSRQLSVQDLKIN